MSNEKMREEFEEWAEKHKMSLGRDGVVVDYSCRYTDLAWNAWQASRAAIEVEISGYDSLLRVLYDGVDINDVVKSIEAQGLRVKVTP